MRLVSICGVLTASLVVCPALAEDCPGNPEAMGTSRTLVVNPADMPLIGGHQYNKTLPLEPKEFVLTLDDGPMPPQTVEALEFLKNECAKATFFLIGRNSRTYPELVQRIAKEGHTVATHTQTHAYLSRMSFERGVREIDDGFRAAQDALTPINMKVAPFFRFPGLLGSPTLEGYMQSHGIAVVNTDVLASDWFHRLQSKPEGILERAVSRLEEKGSGILLLHDVKKVTVGLLPELFKRLKERGFKLVHMVAPEGAVPTIPPAPEAAVASNSKEPDKQVRPARHSRRMAHHRGHRYRTYRSHSAHLTANRDIAN